jgi:hypothetical protein
MATRQIVGWSMADHLRTELCTGALVMALQRWQQQSGLIRAVLHRTAALIDFRSGGLRSENYAAMPVLTCSCLRAPGPGCDSEAEGRRGLVQFQSGPQQMCSQEQRLDGPVAASGRIVAVIFE